MARRASVVPENLGQKTSSAVNARLDSSGRHAEDLRRLIDGQALEVNEDDGAAELLGNLLQGILDVRSQFRREERVAGSRVCRIHALRERVCLSPLGAS